jgi:hypothetical protein
MRIRCPDRWIFCCEITRREQTEHHHSGDFEMLLMYRDYHASTAFVWVLVAVIEMRVSKDAALVSMPVSMLYCM